MKWHDINCPSDRNYCPIFAFLHANIKKNMTEFFLTKTIPKIYINLIDWSEFLRLFGKRTTAKPVLSGHSKIDKTKVLKTNGSLMKFESIAEC